MLKKIIIIVLVASFSLLAIAYGEETSLISIYLNSGKTLYLTEDDYVNLEVTLKPENANMNGITFSSSNSNVALIDYEGNITAKNSGTTIITAELKGKKSSITVKVSEKNKDIGANFSVKTISGTNIEEITITPKRYDNDQIVEDSEDDYFIFLPSGYLVQGKTSSYVADIRGVYPFTVYYGNSKRTFYYNVKNIENTILEDDDSNTSEEIILDYKLKYDYEKKQILFYLELDKVRTVVTPDNKTYITNNINYYFSSLKNNAPLDFSIKIDDETYDYKVIKQGEFYLLISLSSAYYDDYSSIAYYQGYNFTTNANFKTVPSSDIFYDNGSYEVLIQSDNMTKEIFYFNISDMDYRRPEVDIEILDDNTFELDIEDDFGIDYIITFDGKYVSIGKGKENVTSYIYNHSTVINYDGSYIFTVVDKAGNRTVAAIDINHLSAPKKHSINYDVHNYKNTEDLFKNTGLKYYENNDDDSSTFDIIFPSYMIGSSPTNFYPDSPITRGEIITLLCRVTDLPYDSSAFLKTKFKDIGNHWARDYISMGSNKKYVTGYKDNTFRPDNNVTRAEFCEMLNNIGFFKSKLSNIPASSNYNYSDINGHWAQAEIIKIANRDIVSGKNNYFYPDKPITRSEVVHAINMLYNLNPTPGELEYIDSLYKKYYSYNDITNHKYYNDIIISVVGMYREISN